MADFARWIAAAESAMPWPLGSFASRYQANRNEGIESALEADVVGETLQGFMATQTEWSGTATQLLEEVAQKVEEGVLRDKRRWPQDVRTLGNHLRRLAPLLRSKGIHYERSTSHHPRLIKLLRVQPSGIEKGQNAVPLVPDVKEPSEDTSLMTGTCHHETLSPLCTPSIALSSRPSLIDDNVTRSHVMSSHDGIQTYAGPGDKGDKSSTGLSFDSHRKDINSENEPTGTEEGDWPLQLSELPVHLQIRFEERAAILEFDGHISREEADARAMKELGIPQQGALGGMETWN